MSEGRKLRQGGRLCGNRWWDTCCLHLCDPLGGASCDKESLLHMLYFVAAANIIVSKFATVPLPPTWWSLYVPASTLYQSFRVYSLGA